MVASNSYSVGGLRLHVSREDGDNPTGAGGAELPERRFQLAADGGSESIAIRLGKSPAQVPLDRSRTAA